MTLKILRWLGWGWDKYFLGSWVPSQILFCLPFSHEVLLAHTHPLSSSRLPISPRLPVWHPPIILQHSAQVTPLSLGLSGISIKSHLTEMISLSEIPQAHLRQKEKNIIVAFLWDILNKYVFVEWFSKYGLGSILLNFRSSVGRSRLLGFNWGAHGVLTCKCGAYYAW